MKEDIEVLVDYLARERNEASIVEWAAFNRTALKMVTDIGDYLPLPLYWQERVNAIVHLTVCCLSGDRWWRLAKHYRVSRETGEYILSLKGE